MRQAPSLLLVTAFTLLASASNAVLGQERPDIRHAVLAEARERTPEISTLDVQRILTDRSAIVFDTRPFREFAVSHIPGAQNLSAKPGVAMSLYVSDAAAVGRAVGGDKNAAVVLYCNGPFCGKSKRLAEEMVAAGHTNVRRYQLGIPVWRALGGVTEIEPEGLRYVRRADATAVVIDTREPDAHKAGTIAGARNLPRSKVLEGKDVGEVKRAKDDGRLPMEDHNTRVIVVGSTPAEARYVAEALTREAFHNVAYFPGTFEQAQASLKTERTPEVRP
jgi:rhodanese-related sulfurtransferase